MLLLLWLIRLHSTASKLVLKTFHVPTSPECQDCGLVHPIQMTHGEYLASEDVETTDKDFPSFFKYLMSNHVLSSVDKWYLPS